MCSTLGYPDLFSKAINGFVQFFMERRELARTGSSISVKPLTFRMADRSPCLAFQGAWAA